MFCTGASGGGGGVVCVYIYIYIYVQLQSSSICSLEFDSQLIVGESNVYLDRLFIIFLFEFTIPL